MIPSSVPHLRAKHWLRIAIAAGGAAGVGAAAGLFGARQGGEAHISYADHPLSMYTYGSLDCAPGDEKDPINLVFIGTVETSDDVSVHALLHGDWEYHNGSDQYFWDHGRCQIYDDQSASEPSILGIPQTRYHMRYNHGDIDGPAGRQADWNIGPGQFASYYDLGSAHHEGVCNVFDHQTDPNDTDPPGGFNKGRDEVYNQWLSLSANDGHALLAVEDWGNRKHLLQCDGEYAWSDGIVFYISMPSPSGTSPDRAFPRW